MKRKTKEEKELDKLAKEELAADKELEEKPLDMFFNLFEKDEEEIEF